MALVDSVLVRAFTGDDGGHGAAVLVVLEPFDMILPADQRQRLADLLGIPAVAFVRPPREGRAELAIHGSYGLPIAFGGHPVLGTVEALHTRGVAVTELHPTAGPVPCGRDTDGVCRLTAPAGWSKPWRHYRMGSAAEIDALTGLPDGEDFTQVWAWIDEPGGEVRARLWAPRINKGEDEACGSASMLLAQRLGRSLLVRHGRGSVIHVDPVDATRVRLGGRCVAGAPPLEVTSEVSRAYADLAG